MSYRVRKALIMTIILTVFMVIFIHFIRGTQSEASDTLRVNERKFFTSYVVRSGDTLWSIAEKYITDEYRSYDEYISELKESNHLGESYLYEGQLLVVPYYADEPIAADT